MRRLIQSLVLIAILALSSNAFATKSPKVKFYNFDDQTFMSGVNKPATLYTNARDKVRFERLLRLKRSFIPDLLKTSKEPVFR